jgi:hypothetical protein
MFIYLSIYISQPIYLSIYLSFFLYLSIYLIPLGPQGIRETFRLTICLWTCKLIDNFN